MIPGGTLLSASPHNLTRALRARSLPAAYLQHLATRPVLTKSITSGTLSCVATHTVCFKVGRRVDTDGLSPSSHYNRLLSEIIAGHVAGSPPAALTPKERTGIAPVDFLKRNHKALKLAAYGETISVASGRGWNYTEIIALLGFFVSAPLGHAMLAILQKVFAGKTSARSKLAMIISSNIFISPIQQSVYSECPISFV